MNEHRTLFFETQWGEDVQMTTGEGFLMNAKAGKRLSKHDQHLELTEEVIIMKCNKTSYIMKCNKILLWISWNIKYTLCLINNINNIYRTPPAVSPPCGPLSCRPGWRSCRWRPCTSGGSGCRRRSRRRTFLRCSEKWCNKTRLIRRYLCNACEIQCQKKTPKIFRLKNGPYFGVHIN